MSASYCASTGVAQEGSTTTGQPLQRVDSDLERQVTIARSVLSVLFSTGATAHAKMDPFS